MSPPCLNHHSIASVLQTWNLLRILKLRKCQKVPPLSAHTMHLQQWLLNVQTEDASPGNFRTLPIFAQERERAPEWQDRPIQTAQLMPLTKLSNRPFLCRVPALTVAKTSSREADLLVERTKKSICIKTLNHCSIASEPKSDGFLVPDNSTDDLNQTLTQFFFSRGGRLLTHLCRNASEPESGRAVLTLSSSSPIASRPSPSACVTSSISSWAIAFRRLSSRPRCSHAIADPRCLRSHR